MNNSAKNVAIRLALDNDFESIYQIWLEGIENSFDAKRFDQNELKQKFKDNFEKREGIFNYWVATDFESNILGWQSLIKFSNNPFRQNTYAESSTYITKNTRFKGLGKMLLDYVMQEAEKSSLEYVIGFVSLSNDAARKITEETGWVKVGIMPNSKKGENKFLKSFLVRPV